MRLADKTIIITGAGSGIGYALAGLSNYFLRRPFVADAVFLVTTMATVAFLNGCLQVQIPQESALKPLAAISLHSATERYW